MTSFCDHAWQSTTELRAAIHALPFNRELAAGTLDPARFGFYITQDALYLDQYARILVIAGAKGPDGATLRLFGECALQAVAVEQALHAQYLTQSAAAPAPPEPSPAQPSPAQPSPAEPSPALPSPDCLNYTSFLLATAYHEPWEVLMAALLPCFWIYWDVGNAIARTAAPDNKYRAWIGTYSDTAFGDAVRAVIAATDRAAAAATDGLRARMMTAFTRSTQYEYLFWDGAYQQRGWPLSD
ncbi:TenA family protein [Rhodopila sp.]|uniref:TenA family protein n=1 Tax=Rhodopila sp. TaxID=2480087 RepID=UPI003D0DE32D